MSESRGSEWLEVGVACCEGGKKRRWRKGKGRMRRGRGGGGGRGRGRRRKGEGDERRRGRGREEEKGEKKGCRVNPSIPCCS